ncbi:MAG: hypothetical protein ACI9W2_001941 [Gammaproteobacteria bacterium]|jgi:hypothetical protein
MYSSNRPLSALANRASRSSPVNQDSSARKTVVSQTRVLAVPPLRTASLSPCTRLSTLVLPTETSTTRAAGHFLVGSRRGSRAGTALQNGCPPKFFTLNSSTLHLPLGIHDRGEANGTVTAGWSDVDLGTLARIVLVLDEAPRRRTIAHE